MIKTTTPSLLVLRKIVNFVAIRPRSRHEVVTRLNTYTGDSQIINSALDFLDRKKLLDDRKFASGWVRSRSSSHSRTVLEFELRQKGIDQELIKELLEEVSDRESLTTLMRKKVGVDKSKLFRYCMGKGYSYSLIKEVFCDLTSSC